MGPRLRARVAVQHGVAVGLDGPHSHGSAALTQVEVPAGTVGKPEPTVALEHPRVRAVLIDHHDRGGVAGEGAAGEGVDEVVVELEIAHRGGLFLEDHVDAHDRGHDQHTHAVVGGDGVVDVEDVVVR